jgi:hypothetical protein
MAERPGDTDDDDTDSDERPRCPAEIAQPAGLRERCAELPHLLVGQTESAVLVDGMCVRGAQGAALLSRATDSLSVSSGQAVITSSRWDEEPLPTVHQPFIPRG